MIKKVLLIVFSAFLALPAIQAQNRSVFFAHTCTDENTNANYTYLNHPMLNGNPDAKLLVTHNWNPYNTSGMSNDNTIGIWYDYNSAQWSIYIESEANMPIGTSFNVMVLQDDADVAAIGTASFDNTLGSNYWFYDNAALNNNETALVFESHFWNPFGTSGVYNDHETGVWFDGTNWTIFTEDYATPPDGSSHFIMQPGNNMEAMLIANAPDIDIPSYIYLDNPELNEHPEANIIVENYLDNWYNDHTLGVFYDFSNTHKWAIFTEDNINFQSGVLFNIVYGYPQPGNDECVDAVDIDNLFHQPMDVPQTSSQFTNNGATSPVTDPSDGFDCWVSSDIINNSVWFSFEGDGQAYDIMSTNCNGNVTDNLYIENADAEFALYTGSCGALTPVACNDDGPGATNGDWFAELTINTVDGQMYYLLVDGYSANGGIPTDGNFCLQITQTTVGVAENENALVNVYPNPADNFLQITTPGILEEIVCFDATGREIIHQNAEQSSHATVDVSALPSGMYQLRVRTETGVQVMPFVKD